MTDEPIILMRQPAVLQRTGIKRTTLLKLVAEGRFPQPIQIQGTRIRAWPSTAVDAWIHQQLGD